MCTNAFKNNWSLCMQVWSRAHAIVRTCALRLAARRSPGTSNWSRNGWEHASTYAPTHAPHIACNNIHPEISATHIHTQQSQARTHGDACTHHSWLAITVQFCLPILQYYEITSTRTVFAIFSQIVLTKSSKKLYKPSDCLRFVYIITKSHSNRKENIFDKMQIVHKIIEKKRKKRRKNLTHLVIHINDRKQGFGADMCGFFVAGANRPDPFQYFCLVFDCKYHNFRP